MMFRIFLSTVFAACVIAASARAQHSHAGDVILMMDEEEIVTGVVDNRTFAPQRLWIIEMESFFTDEPGYDAPSGTFPASSPAGIAVRKALRKWNATEEHFEDLSPDPLEIAYFTQSIMTPASDPESFGSFPLLSLGQTSGTGGMHVHPWYFLPSRAPDGMYLLELEFWINPGTLPVFVRSNPFWVIFVKGEHDEHDIHEAEEWVEDNLIDPQQPGCVGDLTADGVVDGFDLLQLLGAWGPVEHGHAADLNDDEVVNGFDLLELLGNWGPCPR